MHCDLLAMMKVGKFETDLACRRHFCREHGKKKREEAMGRQHQVMELFGDKRFAHGSGRQEKVQKNCCNVISGIPTTFKVKRLN